MTFSNERSPNIASETSAEFKAVRENLGRYVIDGTDWTVDRERNMILLRRSRGHEEETINDEYWVFADQRTRYFFETTTTVRKPISPETIFMERVMKIWTDEVNKSIPDREALQEIKAALAEWKDVATHSRFKHCDLVLKFPNGEKL
jgi:hypothetical protein